MQIDVFSSGSEGNSTLIKTSSVNILVDAGLSKKVIVENLELSGVTLNDVKAILVTHEHVDHTKGLLTILSKNKIDTFMTNGTYQALKKMLAKSERTKSQLELLKERLDDGTIKILKKDSDNFLYEPFYIDDLYIQPLPMFHDALETIGFVFTSELKRFVYITDTGYVHNSLYDLISNAEGYLLESNHDPEILLASDRPYSLKMRILSDHGHLSNEDSMLTLVNVIGNNTKLVLHAHVSQECNLSQIIELERQKIFKEYNMDISNIEFDILHPRRSKEYNI